jgi:phosphatidylserine/phosphatidylglycerophosphate/cardiolipin synthase-like enzyme
VLGNLSCHAVSAQTISGPVEIHYAPAERLDRIDAQLIDTAQNSIDIAAYVLSDWGVIDALNAAAARGVVVRVVLDPREHSDTGRMAGLERNPFRLCRGLGVRRGHSRRP